MFDDIKLEYGDAEYSIKSDEVLRLVAQIENIISIVDLAQMSAQGRPPLAKIAMAYGAILRYAGADVKDQDIYAEFFADDMSAEKAQVYITTLMHMMIPDLENKIEPETSKGKKRKKSNT